MSQEATKHNAETEAPPVQAARATFPQITSTQSKSQQSQKERARQEPCYMWHPKRKTPFHHLRGPNTLLGQGAG